MKRVGIVGVGNIGRWHVARWKQLPVEVVGYYDILPEASETAQATFGGKIFDGLDALLAEVDIVDVCTPTHVHQEGVLAAAAAGKAIVCEKPLARHINIAEEMIAACEKAGVPLFVAQVVRFFPQFAKAKELLDAGRVGSPGVIRTVRAGSVPYGREDSWFMNYDESGGVIMDVGIHDLDFAQWCFGDVERVFGRGLGTPDSKIGDHALISLRFKNGAVGHVECSWSHPKGHFLTRYEIAGDGGLMEWNSQEDLPVRAMFSKTDETVKSATLIQGSPLFPEDDPYFKELEHFLDCLENNKPFRVTPRDGLMAVKTSLAAMASIRTGKPVDLDTFTEDLS